MIISMSVDGLALLDARKSLDRVMHSSRSIIHTEPALKSKMHIGENFIEALWV